MLRKGSGRWSLRKSRQSARQAHLATRCCRKWPRPFFNDVHRWIRPDVGKKTFCQTLLNPIREALRTYALLTSAPISRGSSRLLGASRMDKKFPDVCRSQRTCQAMQRARSVSWPSSAHGHVPRKSIQLLRRRRPSWMQPGLRAHSVPRPCTAEAEKKADQRDALQRQGARHHHHDVGE